MEQQIDHDFAQLAANYRRLVPHVDALKVLDAVMQGRQVQLERIEPGVLAPCTQLGDLLAEAFDRGMTPDDWRLVTNPNTPAAARSALRTVWESQVLASFAARYGQICPSTAPGSSEPWDVEDGTVVDLVPDFNQVHVETSSGRLAITARTPGVNLETLQIGQRLRCWTTRRLPKVIRAQRLD